MNGKLVWGPFSLERRVGTAHFLVSGTTGSGKTTLIDLLMRSVFESRESLQDRALVYDSKQELLPKLHALGLAERIRILHPYDERCSPWDLASDLDDPLSARQFANILIPDSGSRSADGGFFEDACRDIIAVTIQALSQCSPKQAWTFRDLILTLLYPENSKAILSLATTREGNPFPAGGRVWDSYLDPDTTDDRTRGNIRATLNARLSPFETVAAAWMHSTAKPVSFKRWQSENLILVLGNDEAARSTIDPINRAMFQRAAELVLSRNEGQSSLSWFFLDELREAGRLDSLNSLLLKGRSKGAAVVISFQDIEGLRDVYGEHKANEIVANCSNLALLRTNSADTADWAARMFGKFMVMERDSSSGVSGSELTRSSTTRLTERQAVQAGDLLYLPLPNGKDGLVGLFKDAYSRQDETRMHRLNPDQIDARRIRSSGSAFVPVQRQRLILEPWTPEELIELGISDSEPLLPPKRRYAPRRPRGT